MPVLWRGCEAAPESLTEVRANVTWPPADEPAPFHGLTAAFLLAVTLTLAVIAAYAIYAVAW